MGIIRTIRQSSHKLLSKLGAQRSSHQLVLNPQPALCSTKDRVTRKFNRKLNKSRRESAIPEALLLAAKNYLPPVQFHHVHGPNAQLSKNKFVARRTQSFCHALVFSNRVILPNERVYIKVLEIAKGWSGTIRFGFTSVDPATLRYQMPKHVCPDMTNAGHTWARALADEVVRRNSVIHFSYNTNGYIHYGINNQDCGIFYANVKTSQHLWFIVDIYGLTAAVELIDPRIHNGSSEFDLSTTDDEIRTRARNTTFESTDTMEKFRDKKKRSRKSSRHSALVYGPNVWPNENLLMTSPLQFDNSQGQLLPNLSSVILPTAQQNIYSPMPTIAVPPRSTNESHDYYQITTNGRSNDSHPTRASTIPPATHMPAAVSSALNSSTIGNARSRIVADEQEICRQLDSFQMSDSIGRAAKSPKSVANSSIPIAGRRKEQIKRQSTDACLRDPAKISHADPNSPTSPPKASKSSKARHSSKAQKSTISGDNDNGNPNSKDCPICFERPINCVLYQCGHMCTCYECGVKQWRTQSRTCPICRTVIKDVIKTYMS